MLTTRKQSAAAEAKPAAGAGAAMAMLFILFFACGFLAALNDILIPI